MTHSQLPEAVALRATFYELSLASNEPEKLADFYHRALGYAFNDDGKGLMGVAAHRRLRLVQGKSNTMNYAAYAVESAAQLDALRARATAAGALQGEGEWPGFRGAVLRIGDPDRNLFLFGVAQNATLPVGATALRPARIQHVVFASKDCKRLRDFYLNVLGFVLSDEVFDGEGGLRTAFVRCSHEHHSLAVFLAPENRLDHHCLEAGEWSLIRDWADHFASERIALKWGPGRHGPGSNLFIFVHDPDGNWVEISAELEIVAADRPVGSWPHEERTLNSWGIGLLRS